MTRKIIAMSDYNYWKAHLKEIEAGKKDLIPEVQESAMEILGQKIPEYVFSDTMPGRAFTIWLGKTINPLLRKVADHVNTGYSEIRVIGCRYEFFDVKEDDDKTSVLSVFLEVESEIPSSPTGRFYLQIIDDERFQSERAAFENLESAIKAARAMIKILRKSTGNVKAIIESQCYVDGKPSGYWVEEFRIGKLGGRFEELALTSEAIEAVKKLGELRDDELTVKQILEKVLTEKEIQSHIRGNYYLTIRDGDKLNSETANFETLEDAITVAKAAFSELEKISGDASAEVYGHASNFKDNWSRDEEWVPFYEANSSGEKTFDKPADEKVPDDSTEKKTEPKYSGEIFEDILTESKIPHGSGNYRVGGYDFSRRQSLNADFQTLEDAIKFARLLNKAYMKAGKKIPVPVAAIKSAGVAEKILTINALGVERIYHRDAIHALANLDKRTPEEVKSDITLFDDDYKVYKNTGPEMTFNAAFGEKIPLEKLDAIICTSTEIVANGKIHYRVDARFDSGEQKAIGSFKKKSEYVNFIQKLRSKLKLDKPLKWTLQNESFAWNKKEKKALFVASEDDSHDVYLDDKKLASFEKYFEACAFLVEKVRVLNAS